MYVCIYIYIYIYYTYMCVYIYIYIYFTHICVYIYIYIHISRRARCSTGSDTSRGKLLHLRNRHLGNHRGFSVALFNGFPVTISNACSLVNDMFQRIVTFPVDVHWNGCSLELSNGFKIRICSLEWMLTGTYCTSERN